MTTYTLERRKAEAIAAALDDELYSYRLEDFGASLRLLHVPDSVAPRVDELRATYREDR